MNKILLLVLLLMSAAMVSHARKVPYIVLCDGLNSSYAEEYGEYVIFFYGVTEGTSESGLPVPPCPIIKQWTDPAVTMKNWRDAPEWNKDLKSWYGGTGLHYTYVFDQSFKDVRLTSTAYWFCFDQIGGGPDKVIGCEYLDTSEVTNMECMFDGYSHFAFDISHLNTEKVTNMSYMFAESFAEDSQTGLDFSHFDTSNVTNMEGMFFRCEYAGNLDLSSFKTDKVRKCQEMFKNCKQLSTIYVSDDWTMANVTSSTDMFKDCENIVGQHGTRYNASAVDKTKAHYNAGGYLWYKENTSGIEREEWNEKSEASAIYDISGRKLQSSNFKLQASPGIYVKDGKKYLLKKR